MELEDEDDETLLRAAERVGERFAVLYRRHVEAVLRLYARRGLDAQTAADLTAETFAAAYLSRARFRPAELGGSARPWLLTIAARRHADAARRRAREQRATERLKLEVPRVSDTDVTEWHELLAEVDALPAPQRDAVHARVVEDLPYPEVAARLGATEAAARQRVSRGLAALRARLTEEHR